jgi:hypothetical protein
LDAVGHVLVDAPDGAIVDVGPRGFAVLAMFASPRALGERSAGSRAVSAPRRTSCRR